MAALLALGIFMFYWVTLVNGEKFADRGYIEPWIGMWAANIVCGLLGIWMVVKVSLDRGGSRVSFPIPQLKWPFRKGGPPASTMPQTASTSQTSG